MFSFLQPYLLWIRVALLIALPALGFWAGSSWTGNADKAKQEQAVIAMNVAMQHEIAKYQQQVREQQVKDDAVVGKLQSDLSAMTTDQLKLKQEIKDATSKYSALFSMEFARVWNDSTYRANNRLSTGETYSSGAQSPDNRLSDVTGETILTVHDSIMQECGRYKAALKAIYDWDSK